MARQLKTIVIWKEAVRGVIPPTPVGMKINAVGVEFNTEQEKETVSLLGAGREPTEDGYGRVSTNLSLNLKLTDDNAPIILAHSIGVATSTAPASATSWSAALAVTKGDIVNHSDGLHSLVAQSAGTTGATEPDLSAFATAYDGRNTLVDDNGVSWLISPLLVAQSGKISDCLPSIGVEVGDDEKCALTSDLEYQKAKGCIIDGFAVGIKGEGVSLDNSLAMQASTVEDSIKITADGGVYTPISGEAGYTEVVLNNNYYTQDEGKLYLDGVLSSKQSTEFNVTFANNNSKTGIIENQAQVTDEGVATLTGTYSLYMDKTIYLKALNKTHNSAKIEFKKANGASFALEFPAFTFGYPKKIFETSKGVMLSLDMSMFTKNGESALKWSATGVVAG